MMTAHVRWAGTRRQHEWVWQLPRAIECALAARYANPSKPAALPGRTLEPDEALAELLALLLDERSSAPARSQSLQALRARIGREQVMLVTHALAVADRSAQLRAAVFRRLARRLHERAAAARQLVALRARARRWAVASGAVPLAALACLLPLDLAAARLPASRLAGWLPLALLAVLTLQGLVRLRREARSDTPED